MKVKETLAILFYLTHALFSKTTSHPQHLKSGVKHSSKVSVLTFVTDINGKKWVMLFYNRTCLQNYLKNVSMNDFIKTSSTHQYQYTDHSHNCNDLSTACYAFIFFLI